jgi:FkbM family methyltransferase
MLTITEKINKAIKIPSKIPNAISNKLKSLYRINILKDEFEIAASNWRKVKGDETLRINYPLTSDSIVFDLGGYKGDFAYTINNKYGCYVYIFEPSEKFFNECLNRFKNNPKIKCYNYGLSDKNGKFDLSNEDDGSSLLKSSNPLKCKTVSVEAFNEAINVLEIDKIDLLKINVEGAEYLILSNIIKNSINQRIRYFQIQFHKFIPNAKSLRDGIRNSLSETHLEIWNYPFVWESWENKDWNR